MQARPPEGLQRLGSAKGLQSHGLFLQALAFKERQVSNAKYGSSQRCSKGDSKAPPAADDPPSKNSIKITIKELKKAQAHVATLEAATKKD